MEDLINKLPNEMMCEVFNLLDNEEKVRVMRVSKRWKMLMEEFVLFHDVVLTDETYETVRERFGHRRVGSMIIYNYSRTENPFTNLVVLRELKVSGAVPENALTAILADAVKLKDKGQLLFYDVILTDENYESVRERFGHRRVISMSINNYSRTDNPFTNLDSLRELKISESVSDKALSALFTNAISLEKVFVVAHNGLRTPTESLLLSGNHQRAFPACVKRLAVSYKENDDDWMIERRLGPWNTALDYGMQNVEEVHFRSDSLRELGLDFFWLLGSKPKLRIVNIIQKISVPRSEVRINPTPGDLQPQSLTKEMQSSLSQVRLTRLRCNILKDHTRAWEIILSAQTHLEELVIHNGNEKGFQISMILPVLERCSDTLSTIDLHIDPSVNSTIDIQIFSNLEFLRSLKLQVYKTYTWNASEERFVENRFNVPIVENISTIITKHLVRLELRGFEFSEEDVINGIIIESKRDLDMVSVRNELLSLWKDFERRLSEMSIATFIISPYSVIILKHYILLTQLKS